MKEWNTRIKCYGRTHWENGLLWLMFSGTGIGFTVTARECSITLRGDSTAVPDNEANAARYAVLLDGERVHCRQMDEPERTVLLFSGTEPRTVKVELVKLSESAMSTLAIEGIETDGDIAPLPDKEHLIEFVGDSITCGYGVDTSAPTDAFQTATEDATKAYAWRAADLIGADRNLVSLSGWGIISGWTPDPSRPSLEQLLPKYYECAGFSYALSDGHHVQDWSWRFDGRAPSVVVINLGTNDASYTAGDPEKQRLFRSSYLDFLATVRKNNPRTQILCVLGVMNSELCPMVQAAVEDFRKATGDRKVQFLELEAIRPDTEGYVADFHPSSVTHERIARAVAEKLRDILSEG